jgi:hypothetical protein
MEFNEGIALVFAPNYFSIVKNRETARPARNSISHS